MGERRSMRKDSVKTALRRTGTKKHLKEEARKKRKLWTGIRPCVFLSKKKLADDGWKRDFE